MRIGEYHLAWWKAINILKQDGHLQYGEQEIQEGIKEENIEVVYENSCQHWIICPRCHCFSLLYKLG
jgi:hypothetical protein